LVLSQLSDHISEPTFLKEFEKALDLAEQFGFSITPEGDVWRLDNSHVHRRFTSIHEILIYLGALNDLRSNPRTVRPF